MSEELLLTTLVKAVAAMRACQIAAKTPGVPLAIRREAEKWEQEVDELIVLHLLPPMTDVSEGGDR